MTIKRLSYSNPLTRKIAVSGFEPLISRLWASRGLQTPLHRYEYRDGQELLNLPVLIIWMVKKIDKKKENIWNIPNTLTFLRVLITFITIYCVFAQSSLVIIVVLFSFGMITDFLDGQIARRYNMKTEFGRKFDMVADRFLMVGVSFALVIEFMSQGILTRTHMLQIFLIMSREIITFPFALVAFSTSKKIPDARFIGKLTTVLQGFSLPVILLSINYPFFSFAPFLAGITAVSGVISAFAYIKDLNDEGVR